jgi:hypothetical protein
MSTRYEERLKIASDLQGLNKENYNTVLKIIKAFQVSESAKILGIDPSKLSELVKEKESQQV